MSDAYQCDLCDELLEGCPLVIPAVEYREVQITLDPRAVGFTDPRRGRRFEMCPTCQAQVLRLMAKVLGAEARE